MSAGAVSPPLPEQIVTLVRARASGTLSLSVDGVTREIVFVAGEIRAVRSDDPAEELGRWLVSRELLDEEVLALVLLGQRQRSDVSLAELLERRGCLSAHQLETESQALAEAILERAAAATGAERQFIEHQDIDEPDTLPNTTTTELVLVAARAVTDGEAVRHSLGPSHQVAWPSTSLTSLLEEVRLTPTEAYLVSRLDGRRPLSDLATALGLPELEVVRTLYALRAAGVITVAHPQADTHKVSKPLPPPVVDESKLRPDQVHERRLIEEQAERLPRLDHYAALGLTPKANPHEVRRAWEELQRVMSPTRANEAQFADLRPQLEAILERARDAYSVLSDPVARTRYDSVLESIHRETEALRHESSERAERSKAARAELAAANLLRADELLHQDEPYLAIQLLEQACALDPKPAELVKLHRLLLRNPLWTNRALHVLHRAVEIDPACVDAWLALAQFWRRRHRPERERKALERALAAEPANKTARAQYVSLVGGGELEMLLARLAAR
jgi:DNA-binding Lrp family transcriptional regulator